MTRHPIRHRCACGRPARYYDVTTGILLHLCHGCWRERWADVLEELPS